MSSASTTFACPGCGALLPTGTARCDHCRIRLRGDLAVRLWHLDQQLAALRGQRDWLVGALRRDDAPDALPQLPQLPQLDGGSAPGTETRRVLLGLGAVCLIAALTAATALIWPALGVGGQTTVLLIVTAALLGGAVRLRHRLPATADAIAAVGVAATAVDLVAGRRLVVPDLGGAASHGYWFAGSMLVCALLAYVGARARALHSPTVGAVLASYAAVIAMVSPGSVDDVALVGLLGSILSAAIVRWAPQLPLMPASARSTALVGGAGSLAVGAGAALLSADGRTVGMWCGLALSLAIAAVPGRAAAAAGGVLASAVLVRADLVPLHSSAVVTAAVSAAVLMTAAAVRASSPSPSLSPLLLRVAAYLGAASVVVEIVAQRRLQVSALAGGHLVEGAIGLGVVAVVCGVAAALSMRVESASFAAVGATCAAAGAVAEAFGTSGLHAASDATAVFTGAMFLLAVVAMLRATRARDLAIVAAAGASAAALAAIAVDVSLALDVVRTAEAFVIAPAIVTAVLGAVAMRRMPALSSWALLPALFVATAPTLILALEGDLNRQVVVLAVAAAMLVAGAQGRLVCPLATGAVELALVTGRVLGPEVQQLPRWLSLGVLGATLIGLGSTWERRLQDVRRVAERLRPAVSALR